MKYVVHLTGEELKNIIDESIKSHTMQIKKAIDGLTEQRENELLKIDDALKIRKKLRCH